MAGFRRGWYAINTYANGSTYCMYFKSTTHYTAICSVDANGRQFLRWQDPQGESGPGREGRWLPEYQALAREFADIEQPYDTDGARTTILGKLVSKHGGSDG